MKAEVITPAAGQLPAFRLRAETFNEMQALTYLDACMRQDHEGQRKGFDYIPAVSPGQPETACLVIFGDVSVVHAAAAPPVESSPGAANQEAAQGAQEGQEGPNSQEGEKTAS